ncbi:MAG: glycosyltransferase family 1 protein [Humidesulfovibrio sp.]|uniref:glycosyltransferase n=1 Tax=Humidesulfovibrio sp. TaxID=2910988 RepID=UPI0027ECE3AE|nr:glycosyltransferase [Humidesulfovibrio sp.]MDQ7833792.1 glycosyltransferase family 1 protein [Humidesulfovibrio sp.]
MKSYFFLPPVRQAAGGVTVLRRMASFLAASGREAHLVPREMQGEGPGWAPSESFVEAPIVAWDKLALKSGDLWVVPEGWVNALTPGLSAGARCLVYVQNWAYLLSALPEGVSWRMLPVDFLAVSDPVAQFVAATTGREAPVLRPGIDTNLFSAPKQKPSVSDGVRIAYMPRKNKALAKQIRETFSALDESLAARCHFVEIAGMTAQGVAEALQSAHIFLATGFPEGCPLPPLEAMACGCLPVGYMGFGGADYMRQAIAPESDPAPFAPWWPVRDVPWAAHGGGNGLWSADADILGAALHLKTAAEWFLSGSPQVAQTLAATLANGRATAAAYTLDVQRQNVLDLWQRYEST